MEKISGIVKASPRLTSVDLRDAPPVRPGTPGFGRAQGVSSLALKSEPSSFGRVAEKSAGIQSEMMDWRTKDTHRAAAVADLSERFFLKNRSEPMASPSSPAIESVTQPMYLDHAVEMADVEELSQPEGLYPKGSFLDRTA